MTHVSYHLIEYSHNSYFANFTALVMKKVLIFPSKKIIWKQSGHLHIDNSPELGEILQLPNILKITMLFKLSYSHTNNY